jgi:hypothetical protein
MAVLPRAALDEAADAVAAYARTHPDPARRSTLETFLAYVRGLPLRPDLRPTFMQFTNDLDHSRGQCFAETYPGLVRHLAADGTPWNAQGRYLKVVS